MLKAQLRCSEGDCISSPRATLTPAGRHTRSDRAGRLWARSQQLRCAGDHQTNASVCQHSRRPAAGRCQPEWALSRHLWWHHTTSAAHTCCTLLQYACAATQCTGSLRKRVKGASFSRGCPPCNESSQAARAAARADSRARTWLGWAVCWLEGAARLPDRVCSPHAVQLGHSGTTLGCSFNALQHGRLPCSTATGVTAGNSAAVLAVKLTAPTQPSALAVRPMGLRSATQPLTDAFNGGQCTGRITGAGVASRRG